MYNPSEHSTDIMDVMADARQDYYDYLAEELKDDSTDDYDYDPDD